MIWTREVPVTCVSGVRCIVMADGVRIGSESCPRCERQFLVARGPGHHHNSFDCDNCGAVIGAPELPGGDPNG